MSGGPNPDDDLAAVYDTFGRHWARGTSPLYEEWALGIATDPAVLDLLRPLPRPKRQPNLVFGAARWEGCPLVPYPQWRDWLLAHADDVLATVMSRTVQTNEVTRCATLLPVLSRVAGPLALLEVGTAAGLCLYPDRYGYSYATPAGQHTLDPPSGAPELRLPCRLDDVGSAPERLPAVVWRCGIDLAPVDAADPDAIDWLATLVWPGPDHDGRVVRLRAAAAVAAADPPDIVRGGLLETVADVAAAAPSDATLVVFHSAVLLYLTPEDRRRFADIMADLGRRVGRTVVWLSNETRGTLPEIDAQVPTGTDTSHRFVQTVDGTAVALAGQHGASYETAPFGPLASASS